MYFIVIEATGS